MKMINVNKEKKMTTDPAFTQQHVIHNSLFKSKNRNWEQYTIQT